MIPNLVDLSLGPLLALTEALKSLTIPAPAEFLNAKPKAILIAWCGDLDQIEEYEPARGDGMAYLATEGDPLYQPVPYTPRGQKGTNIRQGVPLWLIHAPNPKLLLSHGTAGGTLAIGHLHPLFNSATVDVFHPETCLHQTRRYVCDPRLTEEEVIEGAISEIQQERLHKMLAVPPAAPRVAPVYRPRG